MDDEDAQADQTSESLHVVLFLSYYSSVSFQSIN